MKKLILFFFTMVGLTAQAYENDTHLRLSYILARAAGIGDAVAKYLSVGNQWVDETAITSAMLLSSQRQLYHFHGDAEKVQGGGTGLMGRMFKAKLSLAQRNHALGSIFLYHGLQQGDLQLFAAGTHTKMDTFGHAGFSNLLGHAPDGHGPDRAFLEPKKYEDMIREMLTSYVALKEVLPDEYLDPKGALDYLNKFAESTHLKRKLTEGDLSNAAVVSVALLADTELQNLFRENMYRKYEYKKLALKAIYESFKAQGKINRGVTFEEVFPDEFVKNPEADTKKVIIHAVIKNANSEFLKTLEGKDIFEISKLFDGMTEDQLRERFKMETERYELRLRELRNMETGIENLQESQRGVVEDRIVQEKIRLLSGLGASADYDLSSEEFVKTRANELAQIKIAEDIADQLTKDLIPRDKDEYIKHQFEEQYRTEMRYFETHYKDDAYRRYIHKNFGVNWVLEESKLLVEKVADALKKFKNALSRKSAIQKKKMEAWKALAEKAAGEMIPDTELSLREKAQIIGFNGRSKALWILKHLKYVLQASPLIYGYYYMKKLSAEGKANALDHATEDMAKAVADGKYKENIIDKSTSAYANVQELKAGTKFRCSFLMNGI